MRRTGVGLPAALAIGGAALGWLLEVALAAGGLAALVPPYSLPITVLAIGAAVVAAGWPIRQLLRGKRRRVDPFRAMRVLLLAKASTLAGCLLGGVAVGIGVYLLSRPVLPPVASLVSTAITVLACAALVGCGLLVERWCRLPPEDDTETAPTGLEVPGE